MRQKKSIAILIVTVAVLSFLSYVTVYGLNLGSYVVKPLVGEVKQGLDLKGGVDITEEIQEQNLEADTLDRTIQAIRQRVDKFGVIDPVITKEGDRRIRIQIPGMSDQQKAIDFIGKTGYLKFVGPENDEVISGKDVKNAFVTFDQYNKAQINLELNDSGKSKFAAATKKYMGKQISIYLDEDMLASPTVQAEITDGNAVITNMESTEEAKRIAQLIKSGALPVTLKVLNVRTIGPSLGSDSLQRSVLAGFIGLGLVMLFMILYYRIPGLVANLALIVFILISLAVFVLFKATLSLSGISGFLLSIGMAVDANVLIFERMKEEIKTGKTLKASVDSGFHRALSSIIDSNVTTVVACIALAVLGSGPVKGFAITMVIGVFVNMFTAITVTRFLLNHVINAKILTNHLKLYGA